MVIIEQEQLAGVPVLHVVKPEKRDERLPLIFFIHGFTSAKEHNLHFGYLLAEAGYRAVLPDALFHGERDEGLSERKLQLSFWDIVVRTITEIEEMKNDLVSRGLADRERIGLAGTSMGGIVTFGALAVYPWVKAAVALMGCPNYSAFFDEMIEEGKRRQIDIPLPPTLLALEKKSSPATIYPSSRKNSPGGRCSSGTGKPTKSSRMLIHMSFTSKLNHFMKETKNGCNSSPIRTPAIK